jgi:hypothetical protein
MSEIEIVEGERDPAGNGPADLVSPARAANDAGDDQLDGLLAAGRRRRRLPWLFVGIAAGAGGVAALSYLDSNETGSAATPTESVTLSAATVETRDLVEQVEYAAQLSFGGTDTVVAVADGTVTGTATTGSRLERGDVIVEVDAEPVVVLIGSSPFWRELGNGDEGEDVLALEANLAALGFDVDGDLTVDGDFTSTTADAVESWEESLGLEPSGEVPLGRVVAVAGAATLVDSPAVGSEARTGQPLATIQIEQTAVDIVQTGGGEIASVVELDTAVEQGDVLWKIDGVPVTAVVAPDVVTESVLDVMAENDIERLEETLVFFGFDPAAQIVVDADVDLATLAAVARWQEGIGLQQTVAIDARYYVEVEPGQTVTDRFVADGDVITDSSIVLTVGSPTLSATADVAADEIDGFAVGDSLVIQMADDRAIDAVLTEIAGVADEAANPDDTPTIEITIELTGAVDDVIVGPATALIEASRIDAALVVPTRALISLREGGFAVEVRDASGGTTLVAVELGTFDEGVVEVVSGDISVGDEIVVPS